MLSPAYTTKVSDLPVFRC
ncbi:hypothetical protein [Pantoea dispersa]